MYAKLFNRLTFSATRKVAVGGAGVVGAGVHMGNNPSFSEVGLRNQPVARTVYSADILDDELEDLSNREVNTKITSKRSSDNLFDSPSVCEEIQFEPVNEIEADVALETIFSSPTMVDSLVSTGLRPGQVRGQLDVDYVFREVRRIVTNKHLIQSARQKMEQRAIETTESKANEVRDESAHRDVGASLDAKQSSSLSDSSSSSVSPTNATWEDLADEFPCAICLDVCAAPHLLNCQHTFCWECLNNLKTSCESQDVEVVHSCPECRRDVSTAVFEMRYDECIRKRVDAFPDCPQKENWREKRESYEQRDRVRETHGNEDKISDSEDHSTDDRDEWEVFIQDYVVPVLVVTVLLLVMNCRRS